MSPEQRQIFRQQSLDKLSSAERLDQMLAIVKPRGWALLTALAGGLVVLLVWAVLGRVPATARGAAVLVRPRQVVSFQSPTSGQIDNILVEIGQTVKVGDLLATLKLPPVKKELEQQRAKLQLVRGLGEQLTALEVALAERERGSIQRRREQVRQRIKDVQKAANAYKERSRTYLTEQRTNLEKAQKLSEQLGVKLRERLAGVRDLQAQTIRSKFSAIEPEAAVIDNELRAAELVVKAAELRLRESAVDEYYDERMDVIRDLEGKLDDLDVREMLVERRLLDNRGKHERELAEIGQRIEQLETQRDTEGRVVSDYACRILEITTSLGQQVALGERLGKMEVDDPTAELKAIAYFAVKDGKKIGPGDQIRVAPTTVERERYGAIVGRVETTSDYPVTTDAAAHQIGDLEVARGLMGGESRIEVVVVLDRDSASRTGYRWTSGTGPEGVRVTPGTTAEVRVTLEERAPISLVLPFLRSLLGG